MMASSEEHSPASPVRLTIPALLMLLGFVVAFGFVAHGLMTLGTFSGPRGTLTRGALVFNLILVANIWGLSWLRPSKARIIAQLVLLAFAALMVSGAIASILQSSRASGYLGLGNWKTLGLIAGNVLVLAGALCGIWMLRPWKTLKGQHEPVSPATRRTKLLFSLSGVVGVLAVAVLLFGGGGGRINPVWSNSQNISPIVAILAVSIWLAAIALSWWWYYSADEHERRANDVGFLIGGGLFMAATPVWWIGYRAGLVPAPDAMILWYATVVAMGIGWGWYRSR